MAVEENRSNWPAACVVVLILFFSVQVSADMRTDYLINMLENGSSYRIKVQAAATLGKIRCDKAVPALVRALSDKHELVVISAATSLGQIGDVTVISKMRKALSQAPSKAARSQIELTLRILNAMTPQGDVTVADATTPLYLVRVDAMGNSAGIQREDLSAVMSKIVLQCVRRQPGVVIQKDGLTSKQIEKKIKKEKLKGIIFSGSILKMEKEDDQMLVKISLNVFSNPDYNLMMMPSAEGSIPIKTGLMTQDEEYEAHEKALRVVVDSLVSNIFKTFADNVKLF